MPYFPKNVPTGTANPGTLIPDQTLYPYIPLFDGVVPIDGSVAPHYISWFEETIPTGIISPQWNSGVSTNQIWLKR